MPASNLVLGDILYINGRPSEVAGILAPGCLRALTGFEPPGVSENLIVFEHGGMAYECELEQYMKGV